MNVDRIPPSVSADMERPRPCSVVRRSGKSGINVRNDVFEQVPCASNCGRDPLLFSNNSAHICDKCSKPMRAFCVHAPGGSLGGEEYERNGRGGLCKPCSQIVDAKFVFISVDIGAVIDTALSIALFLAFSAGILFSSLYLP